MTVKKDDLKKMEVLLKSGARISEIVVQYPQYDYWQVYWELSDFSFMGKKRMITNRIKKLVEEHSRKERECLAQEAQTLLDELYDSLKENSGKLVKINQILQE